MVAAFTRRGESPVDQFLVDLIIVMMVRVATIAGRVTGLRKKLDEQLRMLPFMHSLRSSSRMFD